LKILKGLEAAVEVVKGILKQYDSDSYRYMLLYTAKEGPMRIKCKYLGSDLCIPRNDTVLARYFQTRVMMFCLPISTFMYL
jgi:hypothetical protein